MDEKINLNYPNEEDKMSVFNDDESIPPPKESYSEKLLDDYDYNNFYNERNYQINNDEINDLNAVLEESKKTYEKELLKESEKAYKFNLFKKLDIQIKYMALQKDFKNLFFKECFDKAKEDFINNNENKIYLFKLHYDYLIDLLNNIYIKPKKNNKKIKIDDELYFMITDNIKCC